VTSNKFTSTLRAPDEFYAVNENNKNHFEALNDFSFLYLSFNMSNIQANRYFRYLFNGALNRVRCNTLPGKRHGMRRLPMAGQKEVLANRHRFNARTHT